MVCDVAVIVRLAQIRHDEQVKAWVVLERPSTELQHLLVSVLRDLTTNKTLNMHVYFLIHVLYQDDLAHVNCDFQCSTEAWVDHLCRYHPLVLVLPPDPVPGELLWIND